MDDTVWTLRAILILLQPMGHIQENGTHTRKWDTYQKMGHISENGAYTRKWDTYQSSLETCDWSVIRGAIGMYLELYLSVFFIITD